MVSSTKPIAREKTKSQTVTVIGIVVVVVVAVDVASDWLLHNGECQNQIKVFKVFEFAK